MNKKSDDWRIKEPEWKDYETRYVVKLPFARARTRPPKPAELILSLDGLKEFRARVDRVIEDAERHPQEVAKRREKQPDPPPQVPPELLRPGLAWGKGHDSHGDPCFFVYGTTKADLKLVPSKIGGFYVFKRITGKIRPAVARTR